MYTGSAFLASDFLNTNIQFKDFLRKKLERVSYRILWVFIIIDDLCMWYPTTSVSVFAIQLVHHESVVLILLSLMCNYAVSTDEDFLPYFKTSIDNTLLNPSVADAHNADNTRISLTFSLMVIISNSSFLGLIQATSNIQEDSKLLPVERKKASRCHICCKS